MVRGFGLPAVLVALVASVACTVNQADGPPVTPAGPSDFAKSVTVTAIPDRITRDGASQSSITVRVVDEKGQPASGVAISLNIVADGALVDFGSLSTRQIVTGTDGTAKAVYTAPPAPPPTAGGVTGTVTIVATVLGNNAQTSQFFSADIDLVPAGVILPPAATPRPCMTFSPGQPTASQTVQFTAGTLTGAICGIASSDIVGFAWNFGDGTTGSGRTINHAFTSANTFNVTLTETSDRGVAASITQAIVVSAAAAPVAVFNFSPTAPGINQAVFFSAAASTAGPGHTIASYSWDFGDGSSGSGQTTSHAYTRAGTYIARLTITDEVGQTTTAAQSVSVAPNPTMTATFNVSPASPGVNEVVSFNASASSAGIGHTITSYLWSFGDNTAIASGVTVTHQFTASGTYTVTLRITNEAGETATATQSITVGSPPVPTATFTSSPGNPAIGDLVVFDTAGTTTAQGQTIVRYDWNFGDGTPLVNCRVPPQSGDGAECSGNSTQPANRTISHRFNTAGTFTVNLVVTDSAGRTGSASRTVAVGSGNPNAVFSSSVTNAATHTMTYDGSGSTAAAGANIVSYVWSFGDGTSGAGQVVTHTYVLGGTYAVRLTVTDNLGRTGSVTTNVTVP